MAADHDGRAGNTDLRQSMMDMISDPAPAPASLAFSADAVYLAAGTRTGRVMIWDTAGSRLVAEWESRAGERERLLRVASDMMVNAAEDPMQALIMPTFIAGSLSVHSVAFSPADALLCTADGTGTVQVRTLHGRYLTGWTPDHKVTRWAGYCRQERVIACLNEGKGLLTYDLFTEQYSAVIPFAGRALDWGRPFAVAPTIQLLATADSDELIVHRAGHEPFRYPTAYWRDPELAGLAGKSPEYGSDSVTKLAWSADGTTLATADNQGLIRLWTTQGRLQPLDALVPPARSRVCWLGPREPAFAAVILTDAGRLALWDLDGEPVLLEGTGAGTPGDVTAVAVRSSANVLAAGFNTGEITIWDAGTGSRTGSLHPAAL
jgi:WD40 repeat protein